MTAGNDTYALQENLRGCSRALVKWSKSYYSNNRQGIETLTSKLADLQDISEASDSSAESQIIKQIEEHCTREEMYWQQCSRVNWLKLGDRNIDYFHNVTIQKRASNKILRIQDSKVFGLKMMRIF